MVCGALLSEDGLYRYRLWRTWGPGKRMAWIMFNPSTADAEMDDPTIRRCMGFAKREGYGGIEVINLYALRCTKPKHLLDHPDPEGPDNRAHWDAVLSHDRIGMIVAAWGSADARLALPQSRAVASRYIGGWFSLGVTRAGFPRHPLYVRADQPLEPLRLLP
jgi:hypothetical protein